MDRAKLLIPTALRVASLLACGVTAADVPEMFGCGVLGRAAEIETDGTVVQQVEPAEMADFYIEHCDFIAVGRFSAVTVADYHEIRPRNVEALFVTDEILVGAELAAVRVKVSYFMLVQPGDAVSRNTAANVHQRDQFTRLDLHESIVEDLRDLNRTRARLTDEQLGSIEGRVQSLLLLPRSGSIDRVTELTDGSWRPFVTGGATFYREGGALDPDTQFLIGLDASPREGPPFERLNPIYSLLHWGDYAVAVANGVRAARRR